MSAIADHSSGLDLLLDVRGGRARSLRAQLEEQLRDGVRGGRLHPGTALPSSRALAAELGVSRGVVVEAYGQLVAEGYLLARRGSATRVAALAPERAADPPPERRAPPGIRFDFRVETPDLSAFPRRAWLAAERRVLAKAPDSAFGYGERAGDPALRTALAAYLGRSRGVAATAERVVVTAGIMQGIGLVATALRERGVRRIAVEHPGFVMHREVVGRQGLEVVETPVDGDGIRIDALGDAGAVLVTPAHQMPTGALLAPNRRAALLEWAAATGAFVLEDDYNGEYRYDREPVGALQGLAPERVVYLGSASKTLAPGLRLAWLALPAELVDPVREAKLWADGGSPTIAQLTFADFVARGELDRHLRRMRASYRRRRDTLVGALARHLPGARVGAVAAGLHAHATLPRGPDLATVLASAWGAGVAVFGYEHEGETRLLLGFANLPEPAVEPAVRALADAVRAAALRSIGAGPAGPAPVRTAL